jgi:tetratricopeptide (TPR) repeat protein
MFSLARRWYRRVGAWLLLRAGPEGAYGAGLRYVERGRLEAAALAFEDAQRLWEREVGPRHVHVAAALARRAWCCVRLGRVEEGVRLYERALELERDLHGADSERVWDLTAEAAEARSLLA